MEARKNQNWLHFTSTSWIFLKSIFLWLFDKKSKSIFEMIKRLLHLFTKTSEQKMQKFPLH